MKENAAYYVHMKDLSRVRLAKIELKQPIPILDFECFIISSQSFQSTIIFLTIFICSSIEYIFI